MKLQRIERWLWYAFLFTLAWQTRLIVWQADGSFIEWRSVAIYLSDFFMVMLFILAVVRARGWFIRRVSATDWVLGLFFAAGVHSLAHADHLTVGFVALLRLLQCILFYFYLRHYAWHQFHGDVSVIAFVLGALLQSGLGIAQYALQHDVGLRFMGETLLRTDMRGVAVFYNLDHVKILRAYGTLPHPNILAAYLVTAVWAVSWLWIRHGTYTRRISFAWQAAMTVMLVGLYLTFSRTVIALWALSSVIMLIAIYYKRISSGWPNILEIRKRLRVILSTVAVVSAGFAIICWPLIHARMTISVDDEAVRQRLQYGSQALHSGGTWAFDINWTGVGIGNFTTWLAQYDRALPSFVTQPAHNIYLMMYSELGAVGLIVFLSWLVFLLITARHAYPDQQMIRFGLLCIVATFLVVGMLDHFFWTLQQGRILFWTALALAAGCRPQINGSSMSRL